ncbi:MAG: serine/threonine protein kinase, partial [Myxococcales bacterium]|nr:serine/threonine protein kinase [Myxococcales bacterium]
MAGAIELGTEIGDWRIDGQIGVGGMGEVYAAWHRVIGKRAALKVVRAELCRSPAAGERFVQEARVVNQIGHPNIVDIFDVGTLPDGRPYLVMELLAGKTLAQRLGDGKVPALDAVDILLQVCAALAAAHADGVIHRDLKPDNIFLVQPPPIATALGTTGRLVVDVDRTGRFELDAAPLGPKVKLLDWGIAKLQASPTTPTLTTTGMIVGTPQYVSPEQARGKEVSERTDVYALGAVAYELFVEEPPFAADNVADLVAMHLRETPTPPSEVWPDIPGALDRLLLAMLAKDPEARPDIAEVVAVLVDVRAELAARARHGRSRLALGSQPPPLGPRGPLASIGVIRTTAPTAPTGVAVVAA